MFSHAIKGIWHYTQRFCRFYVPLLLVCDVFVPSLLVTVHTGSSVTYVWLSWRFTDLIPVWRTCDYHDGSLIWFQCDVRVTIMTVHWCDSSVTYVWLSRRFTAQVPVWRTCDYHDGSLSVCDVHMTIMTVHCPQCVWRTCDYHDGSLFCFMCDVHVTIMTVHCPCVTYVWLSWRFTIHTVCDARVNIMTFHCSHCVWRTCDYHEGSLSWFLCDVRETIMTFRCPCMTYVSCTCDYNNVRMNIRTVHSPRWFCRLQGTLGECYYWSTVYSFSWSPWMYCSGLTRSNAPSSCVYWKKM